MHSRRETQRHSSSQHGFASYIAAQLRDALGFVLLLASHTQARDTCSTADQFHSRAVRSTSIRPSHRSCSRHTNRSPALRDTRCRRHVEMTGLPRRQHPRLPRRRRLLAAVSPHESSRVPQHAEHQAPQTRPPLPAAWLSSSSSSWRSLFFFSNSLYFSLCCFS